MSISSNKPIEGGFVVLSNVTGSDQTIVDMAVGAGYADEEDSYSLEFSTKNETVINSLMYSDNFEPLKHAILQFRIKCPLFVEKEFKKHGTGWVCTDVKPGFYDNARFHENVSNQPSVYFPTSDWLYSHGVLDDYNENEIKKKSTIFTQEVRERAINSAAESLEVYHSLLALGVKKEQAKIVLPQSMFVTFIGSINLFDLFRFIRPRVDNNPTIEVGFYAKSISIMAGEQFPLCFRFFDAYTDAFWY